MVSLGQGYSVKEETTRSYWFVLLLGGGFGWIVTDMLADYMLQGEAALAAAVLHLALFLPSFGVIEHFAFRTHVGAD
jgi:hypothetical protein